MSRCKWKIYRVGKTWYAVKPPERPVLTVTGDSWDAVVAFLKKLA